MYWERHHLQIRVAATCPAPSIGIRTSPLVFTDCLQLNNGKFNGVSSFRYYGELLRPELSNLHIETLGLGFRIRRKTSVDAVYHRYRLDQPAAELVDAAFDDRRLNLIDRDVGREWDLIVGFEELEHWEFELNVSLFDPGDAFLGPTDPAVSGRMKVKYVF